MEREEHERLADELAEETDRLEDRSDELGQQIDKTRSDWRAKQTDPGVPGAVEPAGEDRDQGSAGEGRGSEDDGGSEDEDDEDR
jgi:hypothetical protein